MPTSVEERVADTIVTKLKTITIANGYQQDVAAGSVFWPPVGVQAVNVSEMPAIILMRLSKDARDHIRDATEFQQPYRALCVASTPEACAALRGDVRKLIYANTVWNDGSENLARRTWITDDRAHEFKTTRARHSGSLEFMVLVRVDKADPTKVKAI